MENTNAENVMVQMLNTCEFYSEKTMHTPLNEYEQQLHESLCRHLTNVFNQKREGENNE